MGHVRWGVFGEREAYEAFASGGEAHVLAGVFVEDHSGKGASLGLPSPVEWYLAREELMRRDQAFAEM